MMRVSLIIAGALALAGCQTAGSTRYTRDDTADKAALQGQTIRLNGYHHLARDCQSRGYASLRLVSSVSGGALVGRNETSFPSFRPNSERSHCNSRRRPVSAAYYTPARGFTGPDRVVFEVVFTDGEIWRETYNISVR
jgi:hypothetical protein